MDTSHYAALKIGRRSETGREKRVTPKFGEYRRRKFIPPQIQGVTQVYASSSIADAQTT
jgi:hypothetical protein